MRRLGYRPSRKNPNICATCVEMAPPGGMTTDVGVLFADLRGFTTTSEGITPEQASAQLRRFYAHAEKVFFPEALIDKLIGDEVMALYVPAILGTSGAGPAADRRQMATLMVDHARELLQRVGYGTSDGPEFQLGIGIDFGEAFIGNIGNAAVHDFTAVGDVVNTASRLQGAGRERRGGALGPARPNSSRRRSVFPNTSRSRASASPSTSTACAGSPEAWRALGHPVRGLSKSASSATSGASNC